MTSAKRLHYGYDQYLELLERSDFKLEYCDGVIYAMATGTIAHAELSARIIRLLGERATACRTFTSDLKVRVEATDLSTFPDASVVCGDLQRSVRDRNAVTNPSLLVEVTSPSTEDYDRGDKLSHYKQLPALQLVIFISHRQHRVTTVVRTPSGWDEFEHRPGEHLPLLEGMSSLAVDDIYAGIELDAG